MGKQREIFENIPVKHSATVQISGKVSFVQRRIWNVLLQHAYGGPKAKETHTVLLPDLFGESGLDSRNYDHLKECLGTLVGTRVRWDIFQGDQDQEQGVAALLAGARIRSGTVTYSFEPLLRRRLHRPRVFARVSLSAQNEFAHKYALPLYELLTDYTWTDGRRTGQAKTPWLSIDDTREFLGTEDRYPELYNFRRYVLDKVIKEIEDKTRTECWYEANRNGGPSYSHIKFYGTFPPPLTNSSKLRSCSTLQRPSNVFAAPNEAPPSS
jgi:hypothetical protein